MTNYRLDFRRSLVLVIEPRPIIEFLSVLFVTFNNFSLKTNLLARNLSEH